MSGLRRLFLRHQLWALRVARAVPLLGFLAQVSLWLWVIPALPALIALAIALRAGPTQIGWPLAIVLDLLALAMGLAFLFVAPWFFRWYRVLAGLMVGRDAAADRLEARLINALNEGGA